MTSRETLLDMIDGFKEKLTSEEYKKIVEELSKLNDKDDEKRSDRLSTISIPMMLTEKDLHYLGHGAHQNGQDSDCDEKWIGGTCIELDGRTSRIEELIMRTIFGSLGYEMDQGEDDIWTDSKGNVHSDIVIHTNYPWSRYRESS